MTTRPLPATRDRPARRAALAYRLAVGLACATALGLLWMQGALATEGDSPGWLLVAVLGVGIAGALAARLRPHGMARALRATALAQAAAAAYAMTVWGQYVEMAILHGTLIALWLAAAALFRRAARG